MALGILKNGKIYVATLDMSGLANEISLDYSAKELDSTVLSSGGEEVMAGLVKFGLDCKGFVEYDTGKQDQLSFANLGTQSLVSVHSLATEGSRCFFANLLQSSYAPGAKVGDLLAYGIKGAGAGALYRGNSLAIGQKSANGNGTAFNLGALTATQTLWAGLHVVQFAGLTNIIVKAQSDSIEAFSAPADQITFATATGVTSELKSLAGANADTWWRANWAVTGVGTATIVVVMAIA